MMRFTISGAEMDVERCALHTYQICIIRLYCKCPGSLL